MRFRLLSLALVVAVLAACGTDDVGPTGFEPTQPAGRMRFLHAISDPPRASAINVSVEGVPFAAGLAYGGVAPLAPPAYYAVYTGNRQIAVRRTADTTVRLLDYTLAVTENVAQTVIALGAATVTPFVLTDDNTPPAAGSVRLRTVNAAPFAGNVDVYITAQGASIATIPPTIAGLAPRAASAYIERAAGAVQVRFTTAGTKTVVRDITIAATALSAGSIRTIVLLEAAPGGGPLTSSVLVDR